MRLKYMQSSRYEIDKNTHTREIRDPKNEVTLFTLRQVFFNLKPQKKLSRSLVILARMKNPFLSYSEILREVERRIEEVLGLLESNDEVIGEMVLHSKSKSFNRLGELRNA